MTAAIPHTRAARNAIRKRALSRAATGCPAASQACARQPTTSGFGPPPRAASVIAVALRVPTRHAPTASIAATAQPGKRAIARDSQPSAVPGSRDQSRPTITSAISSQRPLHVAEAATSSPVHVVIGGRRWTRPQQR